MKKILYFTSILCVLLFATSCEQERVLYSGEGGAEVSFPSNLLRVAMVAADNNQFEIELWRGNTKGAVSVPVTISGATTIFTPQKNQFDFADGESTAYLKFSYADLNNFGGETYSIKVEISDDSQLSPSGRGVLNISAQRKLTFQSVGTGTFYSEFFEDEWAQPLLKAAEAEYYRMPNLYFDGYNLEFTVENGVIGIAKQPMGYNHSSYGMVSWDPRYPSECLVTGKVYNFTVAFTVSAGSFGKFYETLTMP
jgi:hypothetical protein